MSEIMKSLIGKRVKIVYKDGLDEGGNPKVKTLTGLFKEMDSTMALFELDDPYSEAVEAVTTTIAISEIIRVTEKARQRGMV
jgi:hypothetical protein